MASVRTVRSSEVCLLGGRNVLDRVDLHDRPEMTRECGYSTRVFFFLLVLLVLLVHDSAETDRKQTGRQRCCGRVTQAGS